MEVENADYNAVQILNGMSDSLFDIYQNAESAKTLWESLESKYIAEDASATKFLVSSFMNYKMVEYHADMEQKNQIGSSSVNMVKRDGTKNSNNNKNKRKFKSGDDKFANKKATMTCWKCNKPSHMKKDCRSRKGKDGAGSNGSKGPEKQQGNNKYVITFIDDAARYCYVYLLHAKHEALDKFKIYKQEVELQRHDLIKVLRTDRCGEYYDPVYFQSTGIIHQTTAPYTPQQNGVVERKNKTLKEMVNSMLSYSGQKPNDYVSVNSIIESRDAIFDEERFTSIPRPRGMIQPSSSKIAEDEVEEAIQSEIDSIMHNDTWELTDLPPGCKALGYPTVKFRPNKGTPVSQLEYSRAIGCLIYLLFMEVLFGCQLDFNNMEDHSSTSGLVFLLGGADNEAEWLRNLVYEIPCGLQPMSTISIRCDSARYLAKLYSQGVYGKILDT
ncbi:zinc finger, CCHC-type containing protein [Tanacetum coccineum]|uniref:Zinc finger, CCHC-type containing protein n=1 Tax=Tanacetum coccineum TaxID=301880 RepID=A0ABQ5CA16_9ASTR